MFAVKPLSDKAVQRELCNMLGTEYFDNTMAYFAADLAPDRESIAKIIGICQFEVGETSKIVTLCPNEGCIDDEAMVIMCRSAMSFLWRCNSHTMLLPSTAGPERLLAACGLRKCDGGYSVDLDKFFDSPCKYKKED